MTTCSQNPVVTIRNLLISDAVIIRRQVPEKWENSVFQGQIRQEIQTNVGLIEEKSLDIQDLIRWNLHFPSPIWCAARLNLENIFMIFSSRKMIAKKKTQSKPKKTYLSYFI